MGRVGNKQMDGRGLTNLSGISLTFHKGSKLRKAKRIKWMKGGGEAVRPDWCKSPPPLSPPSRSTKMKIRLSCSQACVAMKKLCPIVCVGSTFSFLLLLADKASA